MIIASMLKMRRAITLCNNIFIRQLYNSPHFYQCKLVFLTPTGVRNLTCQFGCFWILIMLISDWGWLQTDMFTFRVHFFSTIINKKPTLSKLSPSQSHSVYYRVTVLHLFESDSNCVCFVLGSSQMKLNSLVAFLYA